MGLQRRYLGRISLRARHFLFTRKVTLPLARFIRVDEISGMPLLIAALIALVWVNSPWASTYEHLWEYQTRLDLGFLILSNSLRHWINDALLPVFFFVVGIEVKREIVRGELSNWRQAALPVVSATGGMVIPALVYLAFNLGRDTSSGWGIPIATDIAFSLAVLLLLGRRVPRASKILVMAFATVDDIGGILVIAFFYARNFSPATAGIATGLYLLILLLRLMGAGSPRLYFPLVLLFWLAMLKSGVHPTIGGVLLGLLVPTRSAFEREEFIRRAPELINQFALAHQRRRHHRRATDADSQAQEALDTEDAILGEFEDLTRGMEASTDRLTRQFIPWVSYLILPLFALANAGVPLAIHGFGQMATHPVLWGVFLGLLLGKPIGFVSFSWIACRLGLARLPSGISWRQMIGTGLLAGIGFTVSLFITGLAFTSDHTIEEAKLGALTASLLSAILGYVYLRLHVKVPDRT